MRLGELLPREHIFAPLPGGNLHEALEFMLQRLAQLGQIRDLAGLNAALAVARARDVVCIGPRVALPHYRSDCVDRLTLALGISATPLQADALAPDAAPQVIVLILAPPDATANYLQIVSALARLFHDQALVSQLIDAADAEHVLALTRAAELRVEPKLRVRDIMSQDVPAVAPDMPVRQAVDIIVRKRLRALPVVGEKQEVLGSISERDIMRGLLPRVPRAGLETDAGGTPIDNLTVRDVMSRSVMCVSEDLGLEEAAHLMINKDVEQLPVTCEGKLTGYLTRGDLIRKLFAR